MTSKSDISGEADAARQAARGGIQALDGALRVLRTMSKGSSPIALTDLARAAGMPASSNAQAQLREFTQRLSIPRPLA
jgi:IclR helix-turn-helix domain